MRIESTSPSDSAGMTTEEKKPAVDGMVPAVRIQKRSSSCFFETAWKESPMRCPGTYRNACTTQAEAGVGEEKLKLFYYVHVFHGRFGHRLR